MNTKHAIILPNGAADEPVEELGGRTPLEAAGIPYTDFIVEVGRIGTVRTVPKGLAPGSDVATMSLLGYDAEKHYSGLAPIEAIARNVRLGPGDVVFRCNLVHIADGEMVDYAAGHIRTREARPIINDLNAALQDEGVVFHHGLGYRHLMVIADPTALDVSCMPPHDILGEPVAGYLPKGRGAGRIREIMERGSKIVADHEVNQVRRDLRELPATDIWLWGQGVVPIMRRFRQRFGVRGAVIAAVDLIRGFGKLLGWPVIDVPGATGYLDTDYAAKGKAAVEAIDEYDLVTVHIEAPNEAGHAGDAAAKIDAVERIDEMIVGPVLDKLRTFDDWRILVSPAHATPVSKRTHTGAPVPFCMAGTGVPSGVAVGRFAERVAEASDLHIEKGHELMEYFLRC
ncbi:MAG: cofactor-independent phosphoglycerate mutase [Phycisphaerae bacterium]|nr:cofactor-independent phosphoglycerate mutase [Phycisphaerae bacterium]